MRERRRYFRHPVEMPATLSFGEGQKMKITVTNLSEGGMAIFFRGPLPKGGVSTVSFNLPGSASTLEPKVHIAWMDESGDERACASLTWPRNRGRSSMDGWPNNANKSPSPPNNHFIPYYPTR